MENAEGNGDAHHGCFAKIALNTRESREKQNLALLSTKTMVVIFKKVSQISSKLYTWDWIF
jgi:hypothetical protein